jgi:AraC-like DNA-binding protein
MVQFNIVEIVLILNILHLLFFSGFLFSRQKGTVLSYRLLGSFFLSLALNLFMLSCQYKFLELNRHCPHLIFLGSPFAFLYTPFFYLYVLSVLRTKFRFKKRDVLHFLPFVLFFLYLAATHYFLPAPVKREMIARGEVLLPLQVKWLNIVLHVQILIYVAGTVAELRKYRARLKNLYSSIETVNYNWIRSIFIGLFLLWCFNVLRFFSELADESMLRTIETILLFYFLMLIYFIFFKAMTYPQVFAGIEEKTMKRSFLSDSNRDQYMRQLIACMESEEPFLNPNLTIFDLAELSSIPHRALSELINSTLDKNFYDFINEYRVKKAQALLTDPAKDNITILGILYEAGFNSKSVFNSAFKKITGITPSQYKTAGS